MTTRSLNSSVLKWPNQRTVDRAAREWARGARSGREDIVNIGYFGSYSRGDWGVGSDLDLVMIVRESALPFESRGMEFDLIELPVPASLLIYSQEEWDRLIAGRGRFALTLERETKWLL